MSKTYKVASLIAFLTCLFSSLDVNASLKNKFKEQQEGGQGCNYQTSTWYGMSIYTYRMTESRYCFSGGMYRYYDKLFPNGKLGAKLNVKTRKWDRSLNNYYLTELGFDNDYFVQYKCRAYSNSWDCAGPINEETYAMKDYLAYYHEGEQINNKWLQDQNDISLLESYIRVLSESINLNPLNNKFRKRIQIDAYIDRASALRQRTGWEHGSFGERYENPRIKGSKYLKQAIQDMTNALEISTDKTLRGIYNKGVFYGQRASYKLGFYKDRKYGCDDLSKAIDSGDKQAKGYFNKYCL